MKKVLLLLSLLMFFAFAECMNVSLNRGWNFISIPVENSIRISDLENIHGAYEWSEINYIEVSVLEPRKAYWVLSTVNQEIEVCGEPVYEVCIDISEPGWYGIGAPFNNFDVSEIEGTQFYGWNTGSMSLTSVSEGYIDITTLEPTNGYWILVTAIPEGGRNICFGEELEIPIGCINSCGEISEPGYYELCGDIISDRIDQCILISSSNVTLNCLDHEINGNETTHTLEYSGIKINNKNNITIKNCEITNFSKGMNIDRLSNSNIENNNINNCRNFGIHLKNSNYINFTNNQISNIDNFIDEIGDYPNIEEGINILNSNNLILKNNIITNCEGYGIFTNYSGSSFMNNNIFINNSVLYSYSGYAILQQRNLTFINNTGNENTNRGIYIWAAPEGKIKYNEFSNNGGDGVSIQAGSTISKFEYNSMCHNGYESDGTISYYDLRILGGGFPSYNNTCNISTHPDLCEYSCGSRTRPGKVNLEIINNIASQIQQIFKEKTECFIIERQGSFEICCNEIIKEINQKEIIDYSFICKKI